MDEDEIAAVAGIKPMENRSLKGFGENLLASVHKWLKENHDETAALSGLQRTDYHNVYMKSKL